MEINDSIYIAGHNGMVGSAIVRYLVSKGYKNLILKSHSELDLQDKKAVQNFFKEYFPQYVFLAAAKVGGINANIKDPVEFLVNNVEIQLNVIQESYNNRVRRILILGSSCIYPTNCPQPMKEEYLLTGPLEPTNEGYALSKIMALKLGEYYKRQYGFNSISIMPPNIYGPNDSFDLERSHVLCALVRRFIEARDNSLDELYLWGTGKARREFMHVDDLARACVYFMEHQPSETFINVGWGKDISIFELAHLIAKKVGYRGKIKWDTTKPDGMLRKCMNVEKMKNYDYNPEITLEEGIDQMIKLFTKMNSDGSRV